MKDPSGTWEKLHPWTLWFPVVVSVPQIAVLGALIAFAVGIRTAGMISLWFLLLPATVFHVLRFFTFRFQVTSAEVLIHEGILWRQERRIPFTRVQDVKIQQGPVHQLVGLAKVEITTAGSEQREVTLEVISRERAEQIKRAVSRGVDQRVAGPPTLVEPEGTTLVTLSVPQLLLGGLTSRMAATLGALVGVILYFRTAFFLGSAVSSAEIQAFERLINWGGTWIPFKGTIAEPVFSFFWQDTLGKSVFLIFLGFLYSLASYVIRYGRYQLVQTGNVVTKTHGILRFRSSSLARGRVQALKVEEGLLRRWFRLSDVWVDSGGDRAKVDDKKKREPFVPVMPAAHAYSLVRDVLPDLKDAQPPWKRVSPKAILRGSKKLWLVIVALMIANISPLGWFTLMLLPAFPLVYLLNLKWYKNRGYWLDDRYLMSRKGWFNRETLYLPIQVVQNVSLIQSPFDRRLGLATIAVDTAGQTNTGGGTTIGNLPLEEARRLQSVLTGRARSRPLSAVPDPART